MTLKQETQDCWLAGLTVTEAMELLTDYDQWNKKVVAQEYVRLNLMYLTLLCVDCDGRSGNASKINGLRRS